MIVAFDNTFLSLALNPKTKPTPNPATNAPIDFCVHRVEALIDELGSRGDTILIPTPCLAEMLCAVPDFEAAISEVYKTSAFEPAPFDARSAIELANASRKAKAEGD